MENELNQSNLGKINLGMPRPSLGNSTTTQKWNWSGLRPPFAPIFFKCIHFKCKFVCLEWKKSKQHFFKIAIVYQSISKQHFGSQTLLDSCLKWRRCVIALFLRWIFAPLKRSDLPAYLADWLSMGRKGVNFKGGGGQVGSNLGLVGYFVMGELSNKIDSSLVST